jgi:hypothetical protein
MKFPFRPITKPQLKKIEKAVKDLAISQNEYKSMLQSFGIAFTHELKRGAVSSFILKLAELRVSQKEIDDAGVQIPTGFLGFSSRIYFNRYGKSTNNQIGYMASLWTELNNSLEYVELMRFTKKVIGEQYIYMESLSVEEANTVIARLEIMNKEKEVR